MAKSPYIGVVEARFNGKDHALTNDGFISGVQEWAFMITETDGVAGMVFPIGHQVVLIVVGAHGRVHIAAACARLDRREGYFLGGLGVLKQFLLIVASYTRCMFFLVDGFCLPQTPPF